MLNFDETIQQTLQTIDRNGMTYYLDQHEAAGSTPDETKLFYTISQDEHEIYYFDDLSEAITQFMTFK